MWSRQLLHGGPCGPSPTHSHTSPRPRPCALSTSWCLGDEEVVPADGLLGGGEGAVGAASHLEVPAESRSQGPRGCPPEHPHPTPGHGAECASGVGPGRWARAPLYGRVGKSPAAGAAGSGAPYLDSRAARWSAVLGPADGGARGRRRQPWPSSCSSSASRPHPGRRVMGSPNTTTPVSRRERHRGPRDPPTPDAKGWARPPTARSPFSVRNAPQPGGTWPTRASYAPAALPLPHLPPGTDTSRPRPPRTCSPPWPGPNPHPPHPGGVQERQLRSRGPAGRGSSHDPKMQAYSPHHTHTHTTIHTDTHHVSTHTPHTLRDTHSAWLGHALLCKQGP